MNNKIKALAVGFIFSVVCSFLNFSSKCESISKKVLRLHIIANSNTYEDQNLKLKVRNEVIEKFSGSFSTYDNIEDVEKNIKYKIDEIKNIAQEVIYKNGFDYSVNVSLVDMFFNARDYNDVTLPAGVYKALRITIGEAKGRNWWCVMFPPMCLPAAEEKSELSVALSPKELDIVENKSKYKIKFKTVELIMKLKEFIKTNICENIEKLIEKIENSYDIKFKLLEVFSDLKQCKEEKSK